MDKPYYVERTDDHRLPWAIFDRRRGSDDPIALVDDPLRAQHVADFWNQQHTAKAPA